MKTTQLFRDQLGLSQEALAQYLSITRSQLAMYESGKRDLPTVTLTKLAEITLFLNQAQPLAQEQNLIAQEQELIVQKMLAHLTTELEYKQIKEQRILEAMAKKYNQNINLYTLAKHLNNNSLLNETLLKQALAGIKNNGLTSQIKQELKIESVKMQLEYITQLIKKYEKT